MGLNESLYVYLNTVSPLTTLVSSRIYTDQAETGENTVPYITYSLVSGTRVDTLTAPTSMLIASTIQFDCWAKTRHGAEAVAIQLFKALKNFSGVMGTGGVTVSAIELDGNEFNDIERDNKTGETFYRASKEYPIWYYE